MNCSPELILAYLNRARVRCTYEAAAKVMEVNILSVGRLLGDRRPEASWVVNKGTGEPKGYAEHDKHPELYCRSHVIKTGEELLRCMKKNVTEFPEE